MSVTSLRELARRLGGQAVGGNRIVAPGPGHSVGDRSMIVMIDAGAPDGFRVHSFAGDDWRDCRDHVRDRIGGSPARQPTSSGIKRNDTTSGNSSTAAVARAIWEEAKPLRGTPGERYLQFRGVGDVKEAYNPDVLRFHPGCPFRIESGGLVRLPTMVAAMVDIRTNAWRGIHRTTLARDGAGKAVLPGLGSAKKMLGNAAGACLKLTPDEDVTYGLHIAEGIETSLACIAMGLKPLWACLSAGGIAGFPVLSGIDALTIFADNDASGAGLEAARRCATRWGNCGKEVHIYYPPKQGSDFADWKAVLP